ncbi:Homogentisate 1,2-dioxygenase [Microdochium trichocladiopsis]|uniref:homogentisate 1,2-dioxygenase n=1 Tax=Microdochium trichocladiopsis TaxID=1682393 RepID=A0A9P9BX98_9PEZI|nr:Homogentisate 1,2-dioxygenase [Microdochium trichocladiopsis]KAH7035866.1 Homogentisate 1,2-dioxygenase [Microdochium trichocladiopsis]
MPPHTDFAVKDPYTYLHGLGNYHSSEALPGAVPLVNNSPQIPPLNLRTERISGTAFTADRDKNKQTFLYRANPSLEHSEFVPLDVSSGYGPDSANVPRHLNPNSVMWGDVPVPGAGATHWINGQQLVGANGEPQRKEGIAVWLFSVTESMPPRHAFASLDGELLVVPQSGSLDITTELGRLVVRQNEIAVIPRGVRHRVALVGEQRPCRGYICELFQGHFQLPALGVLGSTGLANARDFEIPTAYFDGELVEGRAVPHHHHHHDHNHHIGNTAEEDDKDDGRWTIIVRLATRRWHCTQPHTPFDVAGWHGTCYPYKYDLAKFCVMGNLLFDEHDPSLFTVLSAPNHAAGPGTAVADFAVIPPRYMVAEQTLWLPYFHRNTMQEFFAPIVSAQDPRHPFNQNAGGGGGGGGGNNNKSSNSNRFLPFTAGLHGAMSTHGPAQQELRAMRALDTTIPRKVGDELGGVTVFLFETERPLVLTDWAYEHAVKNPQATAKARAAKM